MDIEALHHLFLESSGVCTDTRQISQNCIFFALKGDNFNGNTFARQALDKGAAWAVIDDQKYAQNAKTIVVKNALFTLQRLAQHHRLQLKIPIIALTGSNGKTTSKELINAVLSTKYSTVATKGNLNNHIGVPLTLLAMDGNTEMGIVEMGANHLGEIKQLSEIARPDYGYITNFGKAHLEGFGSMAGVEKGKTELYRFVKDHGKKVFVNGFDSKQMSHSEGMKKIVFGPAESDYPVELLDASGKLLVSFKNRAIQSNLIGSYNFGNIAAAIAIGAYFQVELSQIAEGIKNYTPKNNRSQLLKLGSNTILMDAYNANPSSMRAALENFKVLEGPNKILYLGDMFELGKEAEKEHQEIADFVSDNIFVRVFLVGENFYQTHGDPANVQKFRSFDDLKAELLSNPPSNATILIKGSRGMALERVLTLLESQAS